MNNEGALKRIIRLVAGALVGTGAGLLSVGGAAAIAPTVAQVCEGLPGYIVLPPPAKAGGVVVCQYDPGWSEAAWWASSKDGVGPVRLTGGIVIVEGVEFLCVLWSRAADRGSRHHPHGDADANAMAGGPRGRALSNHF